MGKTPNSRLILLQVIIISIGNYFHHVILFYVYILKFISEISVIF